MGVKSQRFNNYLLHLIATEAQMGENPLASVTLSGHKHLRVRKI